MNFPRDMVTGILILLVTASLFYLTTTFETDPLGMTQGMPATKMPRLVLGLIAGLTILMMVQGFIADPSPSLETIPKSVWRTMAMLGGISMTFTTIGLPIAFFGVCIGLPLIWGSRNYAGIVLFALGVPAAIYVIFKILLGLRLPMGPLSALGL